MKNSSIFESVFKVNKKYAKQQNKTKELFFKCLEEDRSLEYFKAKLEAIWGKDDTSYLEEEIIEYEAYLHELHTGKKLDKSEATVIGIAALGGILATNKLFQRIKEKEYQTRIKSYAYEKNKDEYLKKLVPKYRNDIKPYYKKGMPKTKENMVREVKPSTYNSMVYNSTLTKNGWIQTLNDGLDLGVGYFYVDKHSFSCHYCAKHQDRKMTRDECLDLLGTADEGASEILHPNCKCELVFYEKGKKLKPYTKKELAEIDEQYHIREKVMSLQLKKEEIKSDLRIYKSINDKWQNSQAEVDKTKAKLEKVNNSIKELQNKLPTEALQKQVIAR